MRSRLPVCLFLLSLLGACADTGCSASRAPEGARALSACVGAALPTLDKSANYTEIAVQPDKVEVIPVRLDIAFSPAARASIVNAIEEWNYVLNGHVRLEISRPFNNGPTPLPFELENQRTWFIGQVNGKGKSPFGRALAQQQSLANGGELVLVFADRVGGRDLSNIMLHELGHALGLAHDPHGQLMSAHYAGRKQHCVDRAAVLALAQARNLPFEALNWCGDSQSVAAATRESRGNKQVAAAR